jgi:hypothetical protein
MNTPAADTRHQGDTRMTITTETEVQALWDAWADAANLAAIATNPATYPALDAETIAAYHSYCAARNALKENTE